MKPQNIIAATLLLIVSACSANAAPATDTAPTHDAQTVSASEQLAALRAETKALREKVKQARAAAKLEKATKARDKARADLLKVTGGVL